MLRSGLDIFISLLVAGLVSLGAYAIYMRFVRPKIYPHLFAFGFTDLEKTWWAWLKARWDLALAVVLAFVPAAYNTVLDIIVFVVNNIDMLDNLRGQVDLTAVWLPGWLRWLFQISGLLVPIVRAYAAMHPKAQ